MAVTKRLRYEILRRDNHACRYCGGVAPDVVLTVDHIVPVALGGSDDPSNLVAACKDCNSGKSATPPGAVVVADVADDAIRWANAMRAAYEKAIADIEQRDDYLGEFLTAWERWGYGEPRKTMPLPSDWERSVSKWYALGLPIEILRDAINTAMPKKKIYPEDMFRYTAGVVWSMHEELQRQVAAQLAVPAAISAEEAPGSTVDHFGHCLGPDCATHNAPYTVCPQCDEQDCTWFCGYSSGERAAKETVHRWAPGMFQQMWLAEIVDYEITEAFRQELEAAGDA